MKYSKFHSVGYEVLKNPFRNGFSVELEMEFYVLKVVYLSLFRISKDWKEKKYI